MLSPPQAAATHATSTIGRARFIAHSPVSLSGLSREIRIVHLRRRQAKGSLADYKWRPAVRAIAPALDRVVVSVTDEAGLTQQIEGDEIHPRMHGGFLKDG
jgi:hypothetical protein